MRITASQTVHGNLTALDPKKSPGFRRGWLILNRSKRQPRKVLVA